MAMATMALGGVLPSREMMAMASRMAGKSEDDVHQQGVRTSRSSRWSSRQRARAAPRPAWRRPAWPARQEGDAPAPNKAAEKVAAELVGPQRIPRRQRPPQSVGGIDGVGVGQWKVGRQQPLRARCRRWSKSPVVDQELHTQELAQARRALRIADAWIEPGVQPDRRRG